MQLWVKNGGNRGWAPLMAAVAIAESGGNPRAHNTSNNSHATGLWQFEWPTWQRTARVSTRTQLYTPTVNARTAVKAWNTALGASNWYTPTNPAGQDPIIAKWKAAGSPRYPSYLQVTTWLGQLGLEHQAVGLPAAAPTAKTAPKTVASQARQKATCTHPTPNTPKKPECAWKLGPGVCLANYCQLKTVKGIGLVVAGGLVMFVGLALIAAGGLGRTGPLGQVRRATRAVGIGGGSSTRRSQPSTREATAQVRNASPEQLRGRTTPSSAGLRRDYTRQQSPPVHTGPFDERDRTADLAARRAARERRPRAPQRKAA
jgi:hypothetical protein